MADPPSHFFKFISPDSKFNLSIPKSFLTKLDGWRDKKAILRRGCHKWAVHITDGGVFGDGWRKFVVENGVEEFDIIVFKHHGNMVFDFIVFDPSACERQYPNILHQDVQELIPESNSQHTHEGPKMLNKRKRTDNLLHDKDEVQPDDHYVKRKLTNNHMHVKETNSTIQTSTSSTRHFISTMKPYSFRKSCLYLPIKFSISNDLRTGEMILRDDKGRSWKVQLKKHGDHRFYLGCGLREFQVANALSEGDSYKLELVENEKDKPTVVNFSYLGKKPVMNLIQAKETSSIIKKVNSLGLDNHPCLNLTMKAYYRKSGLFLPVEFSTSNGLKVGEMILQDDRGRSWKVQLNKHHNRLYTGSGFRDFWVANGLTEGDPYKFELVENDKDKPPVVKLSYQGNKEAKNHIETTSSIQKVTVSTRVPKRGKQPIMKVDYSTPSEIEDCPCYIGKVKSYYIEQSMLYVPSKFALKNGLLNKEEMILKNEDERSWTVGIKRIGNYCCIKGGLKDFYDTNGFKEGILFKLELISNGERPVANLCVQKVH